MEKNLYQSNDYIDKNPTLHTEDSEWKTEKILPLIDRILSGKSIEKFVVLDVGGGAGLILKNISNYVTSKFGVTVEKYAIDLSPGMVELQKNNNPDIREASAADIRHTHFKEKFFDLVLMIDVLEHVPNPEEALKELSRISKYTIFKVPLEDCLLINVINRTSKNSYQRRTFEQLGHINVYNKSTLLRQIGKYGKIVQYDFTNVYLYYSWNGRTISRRLLNRFAYLFYLVSPSFAGRIFLDFLMVLVEF